MEENKTQNKVIETYAGDMAEVIGNDTEGLVKKIIHGAEEQEMEKNKLSPESKKNKLFMSAGIVLVVLAFIALLFFMLHKEINTVSVQGQAAPLIFNDQSAYLEIAGLKPDEIKHSVLNEINTAQVKDGGVEGIYLTEHTSIIGLRRFLALIKSNYIPGNNTLFISDGFLIGAVNKGFFMLLKDRSIPDIFDSLRSWEAKMFSDLRGIIGVPIASDTSYLFTKDFEDGIIENKNARILYDKNSNIVLMYIFADDNSVIITSSKAAAHEVVLRLASRQIKQ